MYFGVETFMKHRSLSGQALRCLALFFLLLSSTANSTHQASMPVEVYVRLTPDAIKRLPDCFQLLSRIKTMASLPPADCRLMRGTADTYRLRWAQVSTTDLDEWLVREKENKILSWFEYRQADFHLQSLASTQTTDHDVSYFNTLRAAPVQTTDAGFVDDSIRRARNLLRIYPPAKIVTIAVIDSGVDFNSPILQPLRWINPKEVPGNAHDDDANGYIDDVSGWDFVEAGNNASVDLLGHGTAVSNIMAATAGADAVEWLRIMPLRVASGSIGAGTISPFSLAEAIHYAVDGGADIINISAASWMSFDVVGDALKKALGKGVKVVAAAGNSSGPVLFPANYPGVMAIGALDGAGSIWSASARGDAVDIYIRGTNMLQDIPGNYPNITPSGTSFAAPVGAALAAMLKAVIGPVNVNAATRSVQCKQTDALWHGYKPKNQMVRDWIAVVTSKFENELSRTPSLDLAWKSKTQICAANITVAALLRNSK